MARYSFSDSASIRQINNISHEISKRINYFANEIDIPQNELKVLLEMVNKLQEKILEMIAKG